MALSKEGFASLYQSTMLSFLVCLIVLLHAAPSKAQFCNICGDGNIIGDSTAVVEFVYEGTKVKNNCQKLQEIVQNVNAISDEFCRTEILQYTKDTCDCATPEGDLLSDLSPPTTAPTPSSVLVRDESQKGPTNVISSNNTDSNVISKCEKTSGSDSDCTDSDVKDTSSAKDQLFVHFIAPLAFIASLFLFY